MAARLVSVFRTVALTSLLLFSAGFLGSCRENRTPNGVISEAVDEMKLSNLSATREERISHLDRAIARFDSVLQEYAWSRSARFLREGGKFNGLSLQDMKIKREKMAGGT